MRAWLLTSKCSGSSFTRHRGMFCFRCQEGTPVWTGALHVWCREVVCRSPFWSSSCSWGLLVRCSGWGRRLLQTGWVPSFAFRGVRGFWLKAFSLISSFPMMELSPRIFSEQLLEPQKCLMILPSNAWDRLICELCWFSRLFRCRFRSFEFNRFFVPCTAGLCLVITAGFRCFWEAVLALRVVGLVP